MKKQVVYIMTDTTRWDMLGCYGNSDMKTPNIDTLAMQGVRFSKAYTTQPVCGPARSAIFTGLYPHSNGSIANTMPLADGVKTLGEYVQSAGVASAFIGKWHLDGGDYFGNGICPKGYDPSYWYDMRCFLDDLTEEERRMSRQEHTALLDGGIEESFTFAHRVSARAVDYIEKHKDEDMLLCVSYDEPHHPYLCPEPYASMYKDYEFPKTINFYDTLEGKPTYQRLWAGESLTEDKGKVPVKPQLFLGCNSYVDYEIGKVLQKIEKDLPDAMIIFTSDHGDALGAHSLSAKGPSIYEEISHVPLIIKGGSFMRSQSEKVYEHVASHIDILPTILDYYDIVIPPVIEGKSMRKIIEDPDGQILHDEVFIEFNRYEIDHDGFGGFQLMRAIVTDSAKLAIHLLDPIDELYDTVEDPFEMNNLINSPEFEDKRNQLHEKILNWMNTTRDPYRGYQWRCRPWSSLSCSPHWDCDGYTRQRPNHHDELIQLDYDTGLEITEHVRYKIKVKGQPGSICKNQLNE